MRRIAVAALMLTALAGAYWACSSDAPAPTPPTKGGGGTQASALVITLFASDANPPAGACTLIQAIVTLSGKAVDDGTGVSFSTDFGVFAENNQPVVSIVTQKGSAIAVLCSNSTGTAFVNASATVGAVTGKAAPLKIVFQSTAAPAPFFTFCTPNFGSNAGGTDLTINGGRFPGSAARATFTAAGVTREALVTSVTPTAVKLTTPAFPEATSPSVPVTINLTFGSVTLTIPNCFAFGTASSSTPTITALLPSSGNKDGNTRVSIIGSGFSAPLQVFFSTVEAQVLSVTFNQIVVLTPPAFLFGSAPPINTPIDVRVREVNCPGPTTPCDATLTGGWRYTLPIQITGISPLQMRADQIGTLTIFGHGFQAPVLVTIGGTRATVQSVSDSEILVVPVLLTPCTGGSGTVTVTNLNTGEFATSSQSLTISGVQPVITSILPAQAAEGAAVTINGRNLPTSVGTAQVLFGTETATVTSAASDGTSLSVTAPAGAATPATCPSGTPAGTPLPAVSATTVTVTNNVTGCSATSSFRYLLPCVVAPDLSISKTGPASIATGTDLTYTIAISNGGSGSAAAVTMTDPPIPTGTTFVSCTPTVGTCSETSPGSGVVTASIGTLPPGSGASMTLIVHVTASAGTILGNTANVATSTPEPNLSNNSSSTSTVVTP